MNGSLWEEKRVSVLKELKTGGFLKPLESKYLSKQKDLMDMSC